jgi:hypothetical protein
MSAFTSENETQRGRRWRGRAAALVSLASLASLPACLENPLGSNTYQQATATTGKTYSGGGPNNSDFSDAAQASGAHDIPCPITSVTAHWVKEHQWAAEGCGQRIDYVAKHKFAVPWQMTLTSRTKIETPAAPPPAAMPTIATPAATAVPASTTSPSSTGGCTKDTDCKGDRICVSGTCSDPPPKPVF